MIFGDKYEGLSAPGIIILLVLTVIYLVAMVMRLEDAGKVSSMEDFRAEYTDYLTKCMGNYCLA